MVAGVGDQALDGVAPVDGEVELRPDELDVVDQAHDGGEGLVAGRNEQGERLGQALQQGLLPGVDRNEPDPRHVVGPGMLGDAGRLEAVGEDLVQGGLPAPATGEARPAGVEA